MSIEQNGVNTESGDNTRTPEYRSSQNFRVNDSSNNTNSSLDFASESSESSIFRFTDQALSDENSLRDLTMRSTQKRYLSVPPLKANIYAFPRVLESTSSNNEFQVLHPARNDSYQFDARVARSNSPAPPVQDKSGEVIDLTYHPDPYRSARDSGTNLSDVPATARRYDQTERIREEDTPLGSFEAHGKRQTNRAADAVLGASYRHLNTKPWTNSEYANYVDKSLAGASSVSHILQEQGFDYANSGSPQNLAKKLIVNGWRLVPQSEAQPGDVIFGGRKGTNWRTGRGLADIGIVGTNDQIFHNDANTGQWRLNAQSRVFPKGQFGDQVWILRAPEEISPARVEEPQRPQFERNFRGGCRTYRCCCSCNYFDDFQRNNQDRPKSYWPDNNSAADQGALDGRRAYEQMRRNQSNQRDSQFEGYRFEDERNSNPNDGNIEDPKNYWNNYWKNYWRDYWRDHYSKQRDGSDSGRQQNPTNSLEHGRSIHDAAKSRIGQNVWSNSPHANLLQNGKLGSAASVSEILKSQGYSYATSPGVANLAKQLLSAGWTPVKLTELRPGDVIYGAKNDQWEKGGGNSHMSIVGNDGYVLHNDSNTGQFKADKVGDVYDQATYGNRIWALRPPADGPRSRPPSDSNREYKPPTDANRYDRNNITDGIKNIVNAALTSVGKQMFRPMLSYAMGRLGCAASVSGVLKLAGHSYANHAGVYGLTQQLTRNGWTKHPVSEAQPGDVIYGIRRSSWKSGGGGSHIGIVGEGNTSYHNSSSRRQWIKDSLSRWNTSRYRLGVYVLRPPQRTA